MAETIAIRTVNTFALGAANVTTRLDVAANARHIMVRSRTQDLLFAWAGETDGLAFVGETGTLPAQAWWRIDARTEEHGARALGGWTVFIGSAVGGGTVEIWGEE